MTADEIVGELERVAACQLAAAIDGDWDDVLRVERLRAALLAALAARVPEKSEASEAVARRLGDIARAGDDVAVAMRRHLLSIRTEMRAARHLRGRRDGYASAAC